MFYVGPTDGLNEAQKVHSNFEVIESFRVPSVVFSAFLSHHDSLNVVSDVDPKSNKILGKIHSEN